MSEHLGQCCREKVAVGPSGNWSSRLSRRLLIVFFFASLVTAGCISSKWMLDSDISEKQLYWMEAPGVAKIKHFMSIKGFDETGSSIKTFIFGRGKSEIELPVAFATGSDGRFAIADTGCRCVHYYVPAEQLYLKISALESTNLVSPVGVAFDDEQRLYISDSALGKIFVIDKHGSYVSSISDVHGTPLKRPTGLAFDTNLKLLYTVDTLAHAVYGFDKNGVAVSAFGRRGDKEGEFNFPTHLFWSPADLLYITDSMNFRIQVFSPSGKFVASFGHHGDGSGDFASPKGVVADKNGVIYVVDMLFDNIQLFDEKGTFLLTLGSQGVAQGEFWLPSGLYIDNNNTLYVCDTYNHRVQVFKIMEELP